MAPQPPTIETFTAGDGYCWQYRRFLPIRNSPRAHVVCVHGIQSHGGWYEHSCGRLADRGFRVDFLDRRGSGLNRKDRGDTRSYHRLVDDLAEYLKAMQTDQRPRQRVFLVAISWGAKPATALLRLYPGLLDGLVLVAPGFFPKVRPPAWERLRIGWSRVVAPRRLFSIPLSEPELFTDNRLRQRFIQDDPLSLRQATARLLVESVRLDRYLRSIPRYVTVPALLMLAELDRIIDNERTRLWFDTFAARDRQVITYPGAHHTLEFESDLEPFLRDLGNWLEKHA